MFLVRFMIDYLVTLVVLVDALRHLVLELGLLLLDQSVLVGQVLTNVQGVGLVCGVYYFPVHYHLGSRCHYASQGGLLHIDVVDGGLAQDLLTLVLY